MGGRAGVPLASLRSMSRLQDLIHVFNLNEDIIIKGDDQTNDQERSVCPRFRSRSYTSAQPHLRQFGYRVERPNSPGCRVGSSIQTMPSKAPDHPQLSARGGHGMKTRQGNGTTRFAREPSTRATSLSQRFDAMPSAARRLLPHSRAFTTTR